MGGDQLPLLSCTVSFKIRGRGRHLVQNETENVRTYTVIAVTRPRILSMSPCPLQRAFYSCLAHEISYHLCLSSMSTSALNNVVASIDTLLKKSVNWRN